MRKLDLIQDALQALQPEQLEVLDESHTHSRGQETHYKAVIVSEQFTGLNSVKRHQKAYAAMGARDHSCLSLLDFLPAPAHAGAFVCIRSTLYAGDHCRKYP